MAVCAEAGQKTEEEASCLADERASLLLELGGAKDELFDFRAEVAKEKKAMEEDFNASCDVIFNYGYGCCAFAHNICGSKPRIPTGMPDTSKPLPSEFFVNPRCPPSAAPEAPTTDSGATIGEELLAEVLLTTEDGLSIELELLAIVDGENEEPNVAAKS